jgi:spore coat protein U-like protein
MSSRALACAFLLAGALPAAADVCLVSVVGPSFGVYDTTSKQPTDAVGRVQISCKSGATIGISAGGAGTFFPRAMRSGASTLAYNLFVDAARTGIWGEWGTGTQVRYVGEGANRSVPIFARIPPLQDVDPGVYSDTLVASIFF